MMTHRLKRRTIYFIGIANLLLSVALWIAPVALAKYRPPKTPSAPKDTMPGASRGGCESNASVGLSPLVPFSHVGQTSTQHPTFTWFVPDRSPHPLQLRLFTSTGQPLYRTQMQSQPGMMQFSLPQDRPGLAIGQSYRWQVVLVCNPNISSMNVVAVAEIAVVKPSSALQTQLAAAQTPQQRIDLYAEAGLWYDAIAEAHKSPQSQSAVLELLDSLASSEAQPLKDWSDRLRQIRAIKRERQLPQPKP
ncbi:DUF928 domain-containing protein [Altericista sp. CCNU0014]|uniref:DUF928 domain-containing protein n=1 Tax=Altericista sp. CCNU0014 TaxID=3082949 RepID=UPI00384DBA4D